MTDFSKLKLPCHSKFDIKIIYFYSELHMKTRSLNSTLTPILAQCTHTHSKRGGFDFVDLIAVDLAQHGTLTFLTL